MEFLKNVDQEQFKKDAVEFIKLCEISKEQLLILDPNNRFPEKKILTILENVFKFSSSKSASLSIDDSMYDSFLAGLNKFKAYDTNKLLKASIKVDPKHLTTPVKLSIQGHKLPTATFRYKQRSFEELLNGGYQDCMLHKLIIGNNPPNVDLHHISQLDVLEIIQEVPNHIHEAKSKILHKRKDPSIVRYDEVEPLEVDGEDYIHYDFEILKKHANRVYGLSCLQKILCDLTGQGYDSKKIAFDQEIIRLATSNEDTPKKFRHSRKRRASLKFPSPKARKQLKFTDNDEESESDDKNDKNFSASIKYTNLPLRKSSRIAKNTKKK